MKQARQDGACPLCGGTKVRHACQDQLRSYRRCDSCHLIFVPPEYFLSTTEEKTRYDKHQNSSQDQGYRGFLNRILIPLSERLRTGSRGLDFGSGPGPTLSVMFEEMGFPMEIYDPYYATASSVLNDHYDFITATEVLEHLHEPGLELARLWAILKPGGHLGIMTRMAEPEMEFSNWYYKNDPTHVCFYSRETFKWLASHWETDVEFPDNDVILFQKPIGREHGSSELIPPLTSAKNIG